jgi:hypothetical protein
MRGSIRGRFWFEASVAALAASLSVLTLVWRDWVEGVFGVDPDRHSGSLEWAIVAALVVAALLAGAAARLEWLRPLLADGAG